jgi:hypothetical protein
LAEYDKIKLGKHQKENIEGNRPGHLYGESEASDVIAGAKQSGTQADGRIWYWGDVAAKGVMVIVSVAVSGVHTIGRVVTAHRRNKPKSG